MRVNLTKGEATLLVSLLYTSDVTDDIRGPLAGKLLGVAKQEPGMNVVPLEQALLGAAEFKAVALTGGFARASRQAAQVGATIQDMETVGRWLAHQGWLHDPVTLLTVLTKWHEWLPRARNFNANMGPVPHTGGSQSSKGRRPPGFG